MAHVASGQAISECHGLPIVGYVEPPLGGDGDCQSPLAKLCGPRVAGKMFLALKGSG